MQNIRNFKVTSFVIFFMDKICYKPKKAKAS